MKKIAQIIILTVIFTLLIPAVILGESGTTNNNQVTFDWTGPGDNDILRYRIQFSTDYGVTWPIEFTTPDTFYTFSATADGPVNIRIKAVDLALNESVDWSPASDTVIVDTQVPGGCGKGVWRK